MDASVVNAGDARLHHRGHRGHRGFCYFPRLLSKSEKSAICDHRFFFHPAPMLQSVAKDETKMDASVTSVTSVVNRAMRDYTTEVREYQRFAD